MKKVDSKQLSEFSLFDGLKKHELDLVAKLITCREIDPGAVIIREDETGTEMYLLTEGVVDIHKTLTIVTSKNEFGKKERSFIRLTGGDHCFFGELALFGNGRRSATVKAVNKCSLMVIKGTEFHNLCSGNPRIGYVVVTNIAVGLAENLRKTNEDVIKLTTALSLALSG